MRFYLLQALAGLLCLTAGTSAAALSAVKRDATDSPRYTPLPGTAKNCVWWWNSDDGLSCDLVLLVVGIKEADFRSWNPSITSGCGNFKADKSYCIKAEEAAPTTTTVRTTTAPPTTTSTSPGNGIETPSPVRKNMSRICNDFHLVKSGNSCASIAKKYDIPLAKFYQWNPDAGSDCTNLWKNTWVCVGTTAYKPTPTQPGNGIETPSPVRKNMVGNCNDFRLVKNGMTCASIARNNDIPLAKFYAWNPDSGSDCSNLWKNTWVCVGTTTYKPTPTNPGNGVNTPSPIQNNMTKKCDKFHFVKEGQNCQTIANKYNISVNKFVNWNPAAKNDCSGLWAKTWACVGVL